MAEKDSNLGVCQTLKVMPLGVVGSKPEVYCTKQKVCWEHPEGEPCHSPRDGVGVVVCAIRRGLMGWLQRPDI